MVSVVLVDRSTRITPAVPVSNGANRKRPAFGPVSFDAIMSQFPEFSAPPASSALRLAMVVWKKWGEESFRGALSGRLPPGTLLVAGVNLENSESAENATGDAASNATATAMRLGFSIFIFPGLLKTTTDIYRAENCVTSGMYCPESMLQNNDRKDVAG